MMPMKPLSDEESLGMFRIIQAEQRFRSALRWLADFRSATWPEVRMFLSSFCPPGPEFDAFLVRIREWESKHLPYEVRDDGRTLDDELRLAMAEFRRGLDSLSLVGSIISPMDQGDSLPWDPFFSESRALLTPFRGSGGFLTITGPPRQGKTGVACHAIKRWLEADAGNRVFTNIILSKTIERVSETPTLKSLSGCVNQAVRDTVRWLWVFDDAGLEWLKQRPQLGSAIGLDQFARIVPKHGGSLIYIDQREAGIPSTISEFAESRIRCYRPGFATVRLPDWSGSVRDIPKPSIPYVSEARSAFIIDVDPGDLIKAIPRPS